MRKILLLRLCMALLAAAMLSVTVFANTLSDKSTIGIEDKNGDDKICTYTFNCVANTSPGTTATNATEQYISRVTCVSEVDPKGQILAHTENLGVYCYMYMDYQDMLGHSNVVRTEIGYDHLGNVTKGEPLSGTLVKSGIKPPPSSSWYRIIDYTIEGWLYYDVIDGNVDPYDYDNLWIINSIDFNGSELN